MDGILAKLLLERVDVLVVDTPAYAGIGIQSVPALENTVPHATGRCTFLLHGQ